jgi:protein-disulfide isomerase-like protein with CxxC motif
MSGLGEQAINKAAEVGISNQLDEVEKLDVNIETTPLKLVSGSVDSVEITGEGLVMKHDLRIEEMQLQTGSVSINPISAAFGKIELDRSTEAEAHVVLTEEDINRAFNSDFLHKKMQKLDVYVDGERATVDNGTIAFGLPGEGKISLSADVTIQATQERKRVSFTAIPKVSSDGQQLILENIQSQEGQDISPELTEALVQQVRELLDLRNFNLEGFSLKLKRLDVQPGKLTLESEALIEQFSS